MNEHETPLDIVRHRYPDAFSTTDTVDAFLDLMQRRLGIEPGKIMLADSICSDDLNTIEYPRRAYEMLGPFKLGGLDGFPFAGLTGMSAFAHHVPPDGAVFVFHGPHIGVSKEGDTGVILRPGQTHHSPCCGAIRAAIDKMTSGGIVPGELTELDYQQKRSSSFCFRIETVSPKRAALWLNLRRSCIPRSRKGSTSSRRARSIRADTSSSWAAC